MCSSGDLEKNDDIIQIDDAVFEMVVPQTGFHQVLKSSRGIG